MGRRWQGRWALAMPLLLLAGCDEPQANFRYVGAETLLSTPPRRWFSSAGRDGRHPGYGCPYR